MATSARETGTSAASASKERHAASLSMARTSSSRFPTQLFEPGKGGKSCAARYRNQKEKTVRKDRGTRRDLGVETLRSNQRVRPRTAFRSGYRGRRRRADCDGCR